MPGIQKYVWITEAGAFLFEAKDEDDAFRRVMAHRLVAAGYQDPNKAPIDEVREQMSWFYKDDQLHQIDGEGGMDTVLTAFFPSEDDPGD